MRVGGWRGAAGRGSNEERGSTPSFARRCCSNSRTSCRRRSSSARSHFLLRARRFCSAASGAGAAALRYAPGVCIFWAHWRTGGTGDCFGSGTEAVLVGSF